MSLSREHRVVDDMKDFKSYVLRPPNAMNNLELWVI